MDVVRSIPRNPQPLSDGSSSARRIMLSVGGYFSVNQLTLSNTICWLLAGWCSVTLITRVLSDFITSASLATLPALSVTVASGDILKESTGWVLSGGRYFLVLQSVTQAMAINIGIRYIFIKTNIPSCINTL